MEAKNEQPRGRDTSREDCPTMPAPESKALSRLDQLEHLIARNAGATLGEMMEATGWQAHSIRAALASALKKRGLIITSQKLDGRRRYHGARSEG